MPIQAPQWVDYLNCPACCREFGLSRPPVSLGCGHTLCKPCIKNLHKKQCPFDQTVISMDLEDLVVNTALLQLAGYTPPSQPYHSHSIQALSEQDRQAYDVVVKCLEQLAVFLKYCGTANSNTGSRLSRPMQRKLVTLLQCAITDEEGRGKAARAARSLGDRTVTELIVQHQSPQQLSANLWAAVRSRGCQYLGPAMQEEVLKLVLLALEDGSALSRKVLVMFVVQRLEPHFPQASKTSIGHVVQLLYRASCFKVSKRVCDSSLMQLKEEFRTYESLRREHDAQIVQIAIEAGLRIAPDQWSALLYGDSQHKSHMQSIIDKLQTPQSFAQLVQELLITLQRTGDPAQLIALSVPLDRLASIDASPDAKSPNWQHLSTIMTSLKIIVSHLVHFMQEQSSANRDANLNLRIDRTQDALNHQSLIPGVVPGRYKVAMCRDALNNTYCPRGNNCTYAHSEEELERYRRINSAASTGNYQYVMQAAIALPRANYHRYNSVPPPGLSNMDPNYNISPRLQRVSPSLSRSLVGVDALDHEQPSDHQPYDQREQPYDLKREQPYDHQREQTYDQSYDHQREPPYEQPYDQPREQPYDHQREQSYDQSREQPYDHQLEQSYDQQREQPYVQRYGYQREQPYQHQREQPYEHSYEHVRNQSYDHPSPIVPAGNYAGSYANALIHGNENMPRAGPNQNIPQQQNGNVNAMMPHAATSGHYYSSYIDQQSAYPYMQQIDNGISNEMAQYSGMAGPGGPVNPIQAEYASRQPPYVTENGAGCHYETISYGLTLQQPIDVVRSPIAQHKEQTWSKVKTPPMFKFDEMAKNLPIGMEHGKTIPIGMDMLKNKPIGMEMGNNIPVIGQNMPAIGPNMPVIVQNMPPIGMPPTNGEQVLEKELKALEQRINSEFCHGGDKLAPNFNVPNE